MSTSRTYAQFVGDRWGEDEWDEKAPPPSALWVRLALVYLLAAVGFVGIVGAAWEYSNWQHSSIPSGVLQDWSPSAYLLAMIVFLVLGLIAVGASWLIWSRRDRTAEGERRLFTPERLSHTATDTNERT
jgi:uncharacterized membrane protein